MDLRQSGSAGTAARRDARMTETTNVWEWLENVRGLDGSLCERMGLREGHHQSLGAGVALPYSRNGEVYARKFRPFNEKTFRWHPQSVEHGLFNFDALGDSTMTDQPIVITEGEFDALAVIQAGFPRAVSVPDGWSLTADGADNAKLKALVAAEGLLRQSPCVIVAADADETGEAFTRAIAALLETHPVRVVTWPEGCKDANDVLRKHDAGALARALNMAKMVDPPGGCITGFSDMPPVSARRIMRLGFDPFDRGLAFEEGAMSVCTGIPGHGKSTFVRFCAFHLTRNEGVRIGAMEFENGPLAMRDHLSRLATGRDYDTLLPVEKRSLNERLDKHWRIAHRAPEGNVEENLEWLRKRVHTLAVRDRCKFIYVDPWNELEHMPEPGETMTNYINWATKSIRQWAERYDTHICIVAHPKKMPAGSGVPDGYDVADSAAWANKPSLGFTVHCVDGDDPHVKINTWKVRNQQRYGFGRTTQKVEFDPVSMVYRRRHQ